MINIENSLKNSFKVWNKLSDIEKNDLIVDAKVIKYKKDDIILQDSNECIGFIIVTKGIIRAFLESNQGKQITLYKLHRNDMCLFSSSCIMKDINFDMSLQCDEDTEIILIPTEKFDLILKKSIIISNYVSKLLASRFSDTIWILEQVVFHSLDKRLANYLLEQEFINNKLVTTHSKIADELGSAREVISRMLKTFENDNIIKIGRNNITLLNINKLKKIAE